MREVRPKVHLPRRLLTSACSHDDSRDQHPELGSDHWHMVHTLQVHIERISCDCDQDARQYGYAVAAYLVGPVTKQRRSDQLTNAESGNNPAEKGSVRRLVNL